MLSIPKLSTSSPKKPGPNMADPDIAIEYKTIALTIAGLGTRPGSIAALAGISKASKIPVRNEIARRIIGVIASRVIRIPVSRHNAAIAALVMIKSMRRLTRSARTPPQIDKNKIGPKLKAVTSPSIYSSGVRLCMSQSLPNTSDHIPMQEKSPPSQNSLY